VKWLALLLVASATGAFSYALIRYLSTGKLF
jgi:hypothetical protein